MSYLFYSNTNQLQMPSGSRAASRRPSRRSRESDEDEDYDVRQTRGSRRKSRNDSFSSEDSRSVDSSHDGSASSRSSTSIQSSRSSSHEDEESMHTSSESEASASIDSRKSVSSESDVDTASEGSESSERFKVQMNRVAKATRSVSRNQTNSASASRLSMGASLALQRRKKESTQLKIKLDNRRVREVDYHKNVTALYTHIEKQRWREVVERCRTHKIEVKTWVSRMDKQKKNVLWRMLPIHTAILYRAPMYVLIDLIEGFPDGTKSPDDRRMLPVHMACRIVCKEDVLRLLLKHEPDSVLAEDIKGRTPRDFLSESKRENKSKVLQKVNDRNRKNLLKILKDYEQMKKGPMRSRADDRSYMSNRSSRSNRHHDDRFASTKSKNYDEDYDDMSRSSRQSRSSRRSTRTKSRHHDKDDDNMSRSSRQSRSSRRSSRVHDDEASYSSRRSRSSRVSRSSKKPHRETDVDEMSYSSRRSRSSRVSRTSRAPRSVKQPTFPPRGQERKAPRLPPQPGSHRNKPVEDEDHKGESEIHDIKCINIHSDNGKEGNRPKSAESFNSRSTGSMKSCESEKKSYNGSEGSDEIYGELWLDLDEKYTIPQDTVDEALKAENMRKSERKQALKEDEIDSIKYFAPPKELQKLLVVINAAESDTTFDFSKRPSSAASRSSRAPLMPGRDNGASRRVNACGALKALAKNEKNRLRLGRTKGVVSSLCNALRDPDATAVEKFRCSNTLMHLSVPKKNWEAIFNADAELLPTLTMALQDDDPRVMYNASFCLFLLSKSEYNRHDMLGDISLMSALIDVSDIDILGDVDDNKSVVSVDGDLDEKFHNLGSPSGIRQQGSPGTDEESKRGARLCALKVFLNLSKVQIGSQTMVQRSDFLDLLLKLSGTMTAEENLLSMAIIANFTRDHDNIIEIINHVGISTALGRGLGSHNVQVQKCAAMALQNLSCNKTFRLQFSSYPGCNIIISNLAVIGNNIVSEERIEKEKGSKSPEETMEGQIFALQAIQNLSIEPRNMFPLTDSPGITASLMSCTLIEENAEEKENIDDNIRYTASDSLSTMSMWLNDIAVACAEKNNVDLYGRSLTSLRTSTWSQWE